MYYTCYTCKLNKSETTVAPPVAIVKPVIAKKKAYTETKLQVIENNHIMHVMINIYCLLIIYNL